MDCYWKAAGKIEQVVPMYRHCEIDQAIFPERQVVYVILEYEFQCPRSARKAWGPSKKKKGAGRVMVKLSDSDGERRVQDMWGFLRDSFWWHMVIYSFATARD